MHIKTILIFLFLSTLLYTHVSAIGDYSSELGEINEEIIYLENCLNNKGTSQVCIMRHDAASRIITHTTQLIFNMLHNPPQKFVPLPEQEVLYLNNPASIEKIKRRIENLEEKQERLMQKETKIRNDKYAERIQKLLDRLEKGEYALEQPLYEHQY